MSNPTSDTPTTTATTATTATDKTVGQRIVTSVFPLLVAVLVVVYYLKASSGGFGKTYAFPLVMMAFSAVFVVWTLVSVWWPKGARARAKARLRATASITAVASTDDEDDRTADQVRTDSRVGLRRALLVLVCFLVLVILCQYIGILVASALFMGAVMPLLGYRRPLITAAVAVGVTVAVWLIFEQFLMISLPAGPWGF